MATTASFATSSLTCFIVFYVLLVVFAILSRRAGNFNVFYPQHELRLEGSFERGAFGWIEEAHLAAAEGLVAVAALDDTVYIHLFATGTILMAQVVGFLKVGTSRFAYQRPTKVLLGCIQVRIWGRRLLENLLKGPLPP